MESPTPPRLRRRGVVDEIEMSDGLSVHCVDTTDVVAVDTAHTKDVLSADATDFMSAHTTQSCGSPDPPPYGRRNRRFFRRNPKKMGPDFLDMQKIVF